MQISSAYAVRILVALQTLMVMTACNLPTPKEGKNRDASIATFTAQAMPDRSRALETKVEGPFELPSSKIFNLQACLKDNAHNQQISGHDFSIRELNKTVTSDKSGCITWSENVNFNFLGESKYIRLERTIVGQGLHKGSQLVSFAINPWSHGENLSPVLNPDDGNAIPRLENDSRLGRLALQGYSAENKLIQRPLWVEDGRLFISEQSLDAKGVNLLIELRPNISLQLTKMNGESYLRPLMAGLFKTKIQLIHSYIENGRQINRVLGESDPVTSRLENGHLALRSPISLSAIPTRGQIFLGFQIEASEGPQGLSPFEGLYLLGDYDNLKGSAFLKLHTLATKGNKFKLSQFIYSTIEEIRKDLHTENIQNDNYQKPKIEVSQLEFRFLRVGAEKLATREVIYSIKACVRNGIDHKNTRAQTFKITKFHKNQEEAGQQLEVKTDDNSCLSWDESITYKYFECQRYLKGYVTIESKDLGMRENLAIVVNPWESQGLIARDLRYVPQKENLTLSCSQENRAKTQIIADGYSYNTLSYSYDVDQFLNLTMTKKIQLKLDAKLLVYSSLSNGRSDVEKLRDGVYLLRAVVVQNKDYDTANTYVASDERFVNVLNGQINTELRFQTQDLKSLGNRNNIIIEIYPVDESKVKVADNAISLRDKSAGIGSAIDLNTGLETPTFIGPITLNIDEANRPLRMIDANSISNYLLSGQGQNIQSQRDVGLKIIQQAQKLEQNKRAYLTDNSKKEELAKLNNFHLLNIKDADATAPLLKSLGTRSELNQNLIVSRAELAQIISEGKLSPEIAQKLCAFWSNDHLKKMYPDKGGAVPKNSMAFGYGCLGEVHRHPEKFFLVEKQMLIQNIEKSQFLKGFNQGLTVGTSFSLSAARTYSHTRSTSISGKFGISKKFLELFPVGLDLGYSMSWSTSESNSSGNSISVNTSTSMTVQHNVYKIRTNKYEQCATIRLNPSLFVKDGKTWFSRQNYLDFLNPRLTEEEKVHAITRGFMICYGEIQKAPVDIIENYYLIAQESGSSQMQDSGDARNRNFFIALRSSSDFERFLLGVKADLKAPSSAKKEEDPQADEHKKLEKLFQLPNAARPSVYLVK